LQAKNFQNASELLGNQLRLWMQQSRKCARTFVIYLARWKLPKCVWTSQETTSFMDTWIVKMNH